MLFLLILNLCYMKKYISSFIQPYLAFAASACSIIGLAVVIVSDKDATIIALITLCMCLFFILIGILLAIDRLLRQNYRKDYKSISSFYVYQSDDGVKSTFECFRLIQCKRMFLSQIEYKFKWSGSLMPKIWSNSQVIDNIVHHDDSQQWDSAILMFKKPLTYNESTVVHIMTQNDDYDGKAKPCIYCKLESPIDVMQFRVLLAYKTDGYAEKAVFERKRISQEIDLDYEYLESVDFNCLYKQYYHVVVNPSPGFTYRLRWTK